MIVTSSSWVYEGHSTWHSISTPRCLWRHIFRTYYAYQEIQTEAGHSGTLIEKAEGGRSKILGLTEFHSMIPSQQTNLHGKKVHHSRDEDFFTSLNFFYFLNQGSQGWLVRVQGKGKEKQQGWFEQDAYSAWLWGRGGGLSSAARLLGWLCPTWSSGAGLPVPLSAFGSGQHLWPACLQGWWKRPPLKFQGWGEAQEPSLRDQACQRWQVVTERAQGQESLRLLLTATCHLACSLLLQACSTPSCHFLMT